MIDDEYILNFVTVNDRIMKSKLSTLPDDNEIITYLKNRYKDSFSLEESLYRIINKIENKGICPYCGGPIKFISFKYGFSKTCNSAECNKKFKSNNTSFKNYDTQLKVQRTIKEKYGVNNPYQIENIQKKAKENAHSYVANKKRADTCIKKYGFDNPSKSKKIQEKISYALTNRSDDERLNTYNKHVNTCIKRFGVSWYSKLPEHREKMSYIISSDECISKRRTTSFEKYNDYTYNNQKKRQTTIQDIINENKNFYNEVTNKRNESLRKNNSFNKSKDEDIIYSLLLERYTDVIRQYRSDKYPFNCDFYIPSLDTYIEYQGSQYHNGHPFDKTNIDDINKLNILKEKANKSERHKLGKKSQYDNIIYVWTDLDVRKRSIAFENKLKWFEFFSINKFKEWFNNI